MCGLFFERYSALLSIKKDVRLIHLVTEKRTRHQETSPRVPGSGYTVIRCNHGHELLRRTNPWRLRFLIQRY